MPLRQIFQINSIRLEVFDYFIFRTLWCVFWDSPDYNLNESSVCLLRHEFSAYYCPLHSPKSFTNEDHTNVDLVLCLTRTNFGFQARRSPLLVLALYSLPRSYKDLRERPMIIK